MLIGVDYFDRLIVCVCGQSVGHIIESAAALQVFVLIGFGSLVACFSMCFVDFNVAGCWHALLRDRDHPLVQCRFRTMITRLLFSLFSANRKIVGLTPFPFGALVKSNMCDRANEAWGGGARRINRIVMTCAFASAESPPRNRNAYHANILARPSL